MHYLIKYLKNGEHFTELIDEKKLMKKWNDMSIDIISLEVQK